MVRVDVPETGGETRILGSKLRRRARFRTDVLQIPLKSLGLWWASLLMVFRVLRQGP